MQPQTILTPTLIREKSRGIKIREMVNHAPIKESLAYAYKMTDLKRDNWPNGLDDQILIDFIVGAYGGLCGEEIKLAFKLGCKGDLNEDMNHYQSFTPIYLGRILKAYSELRQKELAKTQSKAITTFKEPETDSHEYLEKHLFTPYELVKAGKYPFNDLDERLLYIKLDGLGVIMATLDEKKAAMIEAEERTQKKYRQNEDEYKKKVTQKAREICFRNWIENCALEDVDLRNLLNDFDNIKAPNK